MNVTEVLCRSVAHNARACTRPLQGCPNHRPMGVSRIFHLEVDPPIRPSLNDNEPGRIGLDLLSTGPLLEQPAPDPCRA